MFVRSAAKVKRLEDTLLPLAKLLDDGCNLRRSFRSPTFFNAVFEEARHHGKQGMISTRVDSDVTGLDQGGQGRNQPQP